MDCTAQLLTVLILMLSYHDVKGEKHYSCNKPYLELTIAPLSKKIQVLWRSENFEAGSWIGVYSDSPDMHNSDLHKLAEVQVTSPSGWVTTDLIADIHLDIDFTKKQNMGYFLCYWRKNHEYRQGANHDDESVTTSRYDTYPDWMTHFWKYIEHRPISKVFIPGTHNSAGYEKGKLHPGLMLPEALFSQDQNIRQQLALGIRYLDIRVLVKHNPHEYWAVCNEYPVVKLDKIIADVIEFVSKTDKEIVIFDIQQFTGFHSDHDHKKFAEYLKDKMSGNGKNWWVHRKDEEHGRDIWRKTLSEIIERGKVIVSYNKKGKDAHGILWRPAEQLSSNGHKIEHLKSHFDQSFADRKWYGNRGTAAFARLLPPPQGGNFVSFKSQAEQNAQEIQRWFLEPAYGRYTNILAVDYFRGMGTVRTAMLWNERLGQSDDIEKCLCDAESTVDDWYYQHNIIF